MATVAELSAPFENYLLPVLRPGAGVCQVCRTSVVGDYAMCYPCYQAAKVLQARADAVAFVALSAADEQFARDLRVYKNGPTESVRERHRFGLAAVTWRWLAGHEDCVAAAVSVERFPVVTTVPSTSGRSSHPLQDIVGGLVGATRERYRELIRANPAVEAGREARADRFQPIAALPTGTPVLLIDDTWTTGGHAQSAAAALKRAGAGPVGVVALGRHFRRGGDEPYGPAADAYYKRSRQLGWDWDKCPLCDDR